MQIIDLLHRKLQGEFKLKIKFLKQKSYLQATEKRLKLCNSIRPNSKLFKPQQVKQVSEIFHFLKTEEIIITTIMMGGIQIFIAPLIKD
jgi:hypothetical protein